MRTTEAWKEKPGGFDALHLDAAFGVERTTNAYQIPRITGVAVEPTAVISYDQRKKIPAGERAHTFLHFYVDDYRFESVWNRPWQALESIKTFGGCLSPDFSVFADWPDAAKIWNTYRNRWCGAFWQAQGLTVVPTVNWADPDSYRYCFASLPRGATLSVAAPDWRSAQATDAFMHGYEEVLEHFWPERLLVYGTVAPCMIGPANRAQTKLVPLAPTRVLVQR
jgi:hypothetical protein